MTHPANMGCEIKLAFRRPAPQIPSLCNPSLNVIASETKQSIEPAGADGLLRPVAALAVLPMTA
jgi:hypothetical protein